MDGRHLDVDPAGLMRFSLPQIHRRCGLLLAAADSQCDMSSAMTTEPTSNPPSRMGKPTSMTPEVVDRIVMALSDGRSLREICEAEDLPDRSTVMRHLHRDPQFRALYLTAREIGADALADEVVGMAMRAKPDEANIVRVRAEVAKWACATYAPKRWGNRVQAELSGPNGSPLSVQAVPTMMVPTQVAQAVRDPIDKAAADMGLSAGSGTDQERLQRLLASGPVPPDIYEILNSDKGSPDGRG